jgi:phosphoribosylamine--glycine ligase
MNLLLIGSGGREHAIAWKLSQSGLVDRIYVAPGNGGTASLVKCENIHIDPEEMTALRHFAQTHNIGLTIVGPEAPLVAGFVDFFAASGLPVFGPTQAAAQLEGSKVFSKTFMLRHHIPTAWAQSFTNYDEAWTYASELDHLPVIKADGLAAGKGVVLPQSRVELYDALREMLIAHRFGESSTRLLVEERLSGPELSVLAFSDGKTVRVMPAAQDHKRLLDGDHGPNTGGMGAFAPSPLATPDLMEEIERRILQPTIDAMAAEGAPYVGVLYAGILLTENGPMTLEFNCRFGDPETQVLLPLLETDLLTIMLACVEGRLNEINLSWRDQAAVTVVMASGGYPDKYEKGKPIEGLAAAQDQGCLVFHAGTVQAGTAHHTNGGRVLAVTSLGDSLAGAAAKAYTGVDAIHFEGAIHRRDIARR